MWTLPTRMVALRPGRQRNRGTCHLCLTLLPGLKGTALSPQRNRPRPSTCDTSPVPPATSQAAETEVQLCRRGPAQRPPHLLGCELPARLVHILDLNIRLVAVFLLEVLGEAPVLLPPAVLVIDGPGPRQTGPQGQPSLTLPGFLGVQS